MTLLTISQCLELLYPPELVSAIVNSYREIEHNYRLEKWRTSELNAGHFVEAVRRLLDNELFGTYTPLDQSIGSFNQGVLNRYESATGNESYRMIIPRTLYAMYCVRNKRGVGHISAISPSKMDASVIFSSAKWVLAELLRISGQSSPTEAQVLLDKVIERQIDLVWDDGETFMILSKKLKAPDKILIALYKEDKVTLETLRQRVEYQNKTNFRKIVQKLKQDKLIDFSDEEICKLSPLGIHKAESLVNEN